MTPDGESLFENAACGLVLTNPDGTIVRVNATFCSWTGFTAVELVGRRVQELLTMGGRIFHQTHWAPLMEMQGSVAEVKLDVVHRSGAIVPILFNAVRRRHGAQVFDELAVMVVNDRHKYEAELLATRSQLEAANERLHGADRRKTEFLATLAHELRNPLAPIRTGLEIMKQVELPTEGGRARAMMERQVAHMVRLIDDLMDVARIESGKIELTLARIELRQLIDSALEASRPVIEAAGHTFRLILPEGSGALFLEADLTRLSQVLSNVLNNAAKYTPRGGRVELEVEPLRDAVAIRVRDTGAGIEPQRQASIFEMFGQVAGTLNKAQGGLGIGLALARTLTKMHGGRIEAQSPGLGAGSTFTIHLPTVAAARRDASPSWQEGERPVRPLNVLIVEDNQDNAETMCMLMELGGHAVRIAHSGRAGLERAASWRPDLILLDIGLPDLEGYEVARSLRADPHTAGCTLVALTGWGAAEDKRLSEEAGFDAHFTKPLAPAELFAFMHDTFGGPTG
ncbi:MAG: ATP-binding protein [Archangium sp.]|nr:ATP-binding protein [Archangium sp.]MDP3571327.1 ATP-binding protein [Archangium sp.]